MKSLIKPIVGLILAFAGPVLHAQDASFFSFLNAVDSPTQTTLSVNGKKMGSFDLGFVTGGMGFEGGSAMLSVENGDLPKKEGTLPLSPQTSPIVIAYLKVVPPPPGSDAPPKKTIELAVLAASTAPKSGNVRAVYVGGKSPITVEVKSAARGASPNSPKTSMKLSGTPIEVPIRGAVQFFYEGASIGVQDTVGGDNYLIFFYTDSKGKLTYTSALDMVFK